MSPKKAPSINDRALKLLQDPDFFGKLRDAIRRKGLVGEVRNALAIFIVAISSLLDRPLSAIAKGRSSAGKNILASTVLGFLPSTAIHEITSSSKTAWNYSGDDFRNKVVYIPERNEAAGAVEPRLLVSEGKLKRIVTVRGGANPETKLFVANGPIAVITTTTRNRIQIDDETRAISLWVDESEEQTRRIVESQVSPTIPLSDEEVEVWHQVYEIISRRSRVPIKLPRWFTEIASRVSASNVSVRRYFPAFLQAVRTIALICSFQQYPDDLESGESFSATFADYALAAWIFNDLFVESLNRGESECLETSKAIEAIAADQNGKPVDADQLAKYLGVSYDKASAKLREALKAGVISRANQSEKNNNKLFLPAEPPRFVPDPKEVARELVRLKKPVTVVHPLSGKTVKFAGK